MFFKYLILFLIYGCIRNTLPAIAAVDIIFENVLVAQKGLGWPSLLKVVKGNEALMKLRQSLPNQQSCTVTEPSGVTFDIKQPPNNRFEIWGDECGLRVKNVQIGDTGRWRLTASQINNSITGWIEVNVLEETEYETGPPISLQDGEKQAKVALSSLDNAYCVVAKPFAESSLVPGHCSVTLDRSTRAVQGNWEVFLGLPGQVSELQTKRHVIVQTERLDVGYVHDEANKLHLYCNILHSNKQITFCRFQRTSNTYGYNLVDGLSDGSFSYYGNGFVLNQCGITIESPTSQDYSTWRCSVGVQMLVDNVMQQQNPMQALISVAPNLRHLSNVHQRSEYSTRIIFVQKDAALTITCNAGRSLSYCWFQHPNGSQFTPVGLENEEQLFWYTGESLKVGDCGITFAHSNDIDSGEWSCFMGPRHNLGIEITDKVEVRVTGPLTANLREVSVIAGENATLYCHTSNGRRPLNYCRFLSPKFVGMNIDSSVTSENAILNRFYFTPDRELNIGDCSLSINSVQEEDIGTWTCAAVVDNDIIESRDIIEVFFGENKLAPRLHAGIISAVAGLFVITVILIGYVSYKRGWIQCLVRPRDGRNTVGSDNYSVQYQNDGANSISSDSSSDIQSQRA